MPFGTEILLIYSFVVVFDCGGGGSGADGAGGGGCVGATISMAIGGRTPAVGASPKSLVE